RRGGTPRPRLRPPSVAGTNELRTSQQGNIRSTAPKHAVVSKLHCWIRQNSAVVDFSLGDLNSDESSDGEIRILKSTLGMRAQRRAIPSQRDFRGLCEGGYSPSRQTVFIIQTASSSSKSTGKARARRMPSMRTSP